MGRHLTPAAILAVLLPAAALADAALVLGTADYRNLDDLPRGAEVTEAVDGLAALGFEVSALSDGGWRDVEAVIAEFIGDVPEAERLVVALSGRFITDGDRTWYLTADAAVPTLFTLGRSAISVESLMAVLARNPSRAVLVLGHDPGADTAFDPWLREGVGGLDVPQGVTVLTGTPRDVANLMADELSVPGGDLSELVTANDAIRAQGYLPRGFILMPAAGAEREPEPVVEPVVEPGAGAEAALWQGAVALDTVEAYRNYLRAYPRGRFSAEAQASIAAILSEPNRDARLAEEALELSRDRRRTIQRGLALLDFDPRGIDGIFGPGTRAAIINWQQQNGFAQTGFLDGEQAARLEAQAARRAAQLEAEAARQQEAAQSADRAFWEETGAGGDEAGLRAYLDRYPDGLFAEAAGERLAAIEEAKRAEADEADRAAWDEARRTDSTRSYRLYLEAFPDGRFAAEARARREELQDAEEGAAADEEARAAEEALGLNALTARVIEQRLDALGLEPGDVDGEFDEVTRRALRNYQRDRGLPVSGFLNEPTLVRLLADTLGEALRE